MALMAIDMREAMHSEDAVGHLGLEIRVGINSGPVVAGVIGRKRFLYDLWGDAVNTAEPDGVPRHARADPGHPGNLRAAPGRVRATAAGHDPRSRARATSRRGTSSAPASSSRRASVSHLVRNQLATPRYAQGTRYRWDGLEGAQTVSSAVPSR